MMSNDFPEDRAAFERHHALLQRLSTVVSGELLADAGYAVAYLLAGMASESGHPELFMQMVVERTEQTIAVIKQGQMDGELPADLPKEMN